MSKKSWTLAAAVLGSGIVFLDSTVVNVALPRIGREVPVTLFGVLEGQSYVYAGYLVTLSALLILAGALSDYHGRRRMFLIGLLGFGLFSVLCGVAPTIELLILFRILQGAAGALLVPGSLALITAAFRGEEQSRAFGIWAGASAATTILGPAVGGFFVDSISWRAAFLINVPLVAVALYAAYRHVDESRDEAATGRFDWLGAGVIAVAVGGLAFGATRGQEQEWHDPVALAALVVGAVAAVLFPILMARSSHPLVPLTLFRSRNFAVVNLSTLLIYGALYVSGAYQALFLQGTLGYTALAAGLVGLPISILLALFSPRVGSLAGRYGPRPFMTIGPALMAAGLVWFARVPSSSTPWQARFEAPGSLIPSTGYLVDVLPAMLAFAIGLTILVAPLTTALMNSIPTRNSGLGSAVNNAISRVGAPLVSAIIFIAITATFYATIAARVPGLDTSDPALRRRIPPLNAPSAGVEVETARAAREASTDAFHLAMLVAAGLLAGGAVVNGLGIRRAPPPVAPEVEGAEGGSADPSGPVSEPTRAL